ncbi:LuxR C-terminal-related transcriptional regulator [Streptomyces sp. NPDC079020]|uniref:response regulator transcription factor n=1 Tax=Streptomyces sp. NPDC079020 TaxID=3365722 RepID=UPI0037D7BF8E
MSTSHTGYERERNPKEIRSKVESETRISEHDGKFIQHPHGAHLGELFTEQAARTPHLAVVVDEASGCFLSYAEVDQLSDGVADALRSQRGWNEIVPCGPQSALGKLLGLLGTLKAELRVPARYTTSVSRIAELLASGHTKTLLLNKGVALESSECMPAWSASALHGCEEERPSPCSDTPVPVPVREPVPLAVPEEAVGPSAGAQPGLRAIMSPHAPVSARVSGLTRAETAVARLVAEGMTNKEIADFLVVSVHTVGTHVRSSFTKLNVTNRVALARKIIFYDFGQAMSGLT